MAHRDESLLTLEYGYQERALECQGVPRHTGTKENLPSSSFSPSSVFPESSQAPQQRPAISSPSQPLLPILSPVPSRSSLFTSSATHTITQTQTKLTTRSKSFNFPHVSNFLVKLVPSKEHAELSKKENQKHFSEEIFKELTSKVRPESKLLKLLQYLLLIPYDQPPLADLIWEYLLEVTSLVVKIDKLPENKNTIYSALSEELGTKVQTAHKILPGGLVPETKVAPTTKTIATPTSPSPSPRATPSLKSSPTISPRAPFSPVSLRSSSTLPPPPPAPWSPSLLKSSSTLPPPPPAPSSPSPLRSSSSSRSLSLPPPPPPPPDKKPAENCGLPRKTKYNPQVKLKPLHWDKLPNKSITGNNIWMKIASRPEMPINMGELNVLFFQQQVAVKKEPAKIATVTILKTQRKNNIEIGFNGLTKKLTPEQLSNSILCTTDTILSESYLETLGKNLPVPEEVELLKSFSGDKNTLGIAEKYCLEVVDIPNLPQKIKLLLLKNQFANRVRELLNNIATVKKAATQILQSSNFEKMLEGILAVGNYLNANCSNLQAYGFKLDSLKMLKGTKASGKRRIDLLHYIIETVQKEDSKVVELVKDLNEVPKAAVVNLQNISTELTKLEQEVSEISKELETKDETSSRFREVFSEFYAKAKMEIDKSQKEKKEMEEVTKTLFQYFGDNSNKSEKDVEKFFKLIHVFCQNFEQALKDLEEEKFEEANKDEPNSLKKPRIRSAPTPLTSVPLADISIR